MALTKFQRTVCHLISRNRKEGGESYVAGGVALNLATGSNRLSHDIDLFHDSQEALDATWISDRALLESNGLTVEPLRERPYFVEAEISSAEGSVLMQWAQDSAYRFFPLVEHDELGLALHPFDLATNKVLALVGRLEVRDWVDLISCNDSIQLLGYLAWAACGKDPGFSPAMIVEQAGRSGRYSEEEVQSLSFEGSPPVAADLSQKWHAMLSAAAEIIDLLPPDDVGKCVLDKEQKLFAGDVSELQRALGHEAILFHSGSIRGALPRVIR